MNAEIKNLINTQEIQSILINKLFMYRGRDLNVGGIKRNCLFFSIKHDSVSDLLNDQHSTWPYNPRMPVILSDKDTFDVLSKGCPMAVFSPESGALLRVELYSLQTEQQIKSATSCVQCGASSPLLTCDKCRSVWFCSESCKRKATKKSEGKHSKSDCRAIKENMILKGNQSGIVECISNH